MKKFRNLLKINVFVLLIFACQSPKKEKSNKFDSNIIEYVDSTFVNLDSLTIYNSDFNSLRKLRRSKNESSVVLKRDFVKENLCFIKNTCYDTFFKNDYYPLGKISINSKYDILLYENFKKNKFPSLFDEAYLTLFDRETTEFKDWLLIFKDFDGGPINCGEIGFSINKEIIEIKYKKCSKYPPNNEKERYYKTMTIIDEYYKVNNGQFILESEEVFKTVFDSSKRKIVSDLIIQ